MRTSPLRKKDLRDFSRGRDYQLRAQFVRFGYRESARDGTGVRRRACGSRPGIRHRLGGPAWDAACAPR
jgi:hypothetical protein